MLPRDTYPSSLSLLCLSRPPPLSPPSPFVFLSHSLLSLSLFLSVPPGPPTHLNERLIRSDQHVHRQSTDSVASDDPFTGFDWQRTDSDASTEGKSRHGNSVVGRTYPPTTTINGHAYERVDYEPTRSPPRSHSIDILSSEDRSPQIRRLKQHKKAASFESNLEAEGYVQKPYMPVGITVEDLDGGAASAASKSPGRRSLGVAESPRRFSPRVA